MNWKCRRKGDINGEIGEEWRGWGEECTNEKNIFLKRDEKCVLVECMCLHELT